MLHRNIDVLGDGTARLGVMTALHTRCSALRRIHSALYRLRYFLMLHCIMKESHPCATLLNFLGFAAFSGNAALAVIGDVGSTPAYTVLKIPSEGALHELRS